MILLLEGIFIVCFLSVVLIDWLLVENGWVRRAGSSYLFFMNIYLLVHLSEADDRNYMWHGRLNYLLPWRRSQLEIPALRLVFDQSVFTLTVADQTLLSWVSFLRLYTPRDRRASYIYKNTLCLARWWDQLMEPNTLRLLNINRLRVCWIF